MTRSSIVGTRISTCFSRFTRDPRGEPPLRWLVPTAAMALIVAVYLALANDASLAGLDSSSLWRWRLPTLYGVVALVGVGCGRYLNGRRPEAYVRIGLGAAAVANGSEILTPTAAGDPADRGRAMNAVTTAGALAMRHASPTKQPACATARCAAAAAACYNPADSSSCLPVSAYGQCSANADPRQPQGEPGEANAIEPPHRSGLRPNLPVVGRLELPLPEDAVICLCCGWLPVTGSLAATSTGHTRRYGHPTAYRAPEPATGRGTEGAPVLQDADARVTPGPPACRQSHSATTRRPTHERSDSVTCPATETGDESAALAGVKPWTRPRAAAAGRIAVNRLAGMLRRRCRLRIRRRSGTT